MNLLRKKKGKKEKSTLPRQSEIAKNNRSFLVFFLKAIFLAGFSCYSPWGTFRFL
jgi:hypothetical protein